MASGEFAKTVSRVLAGMRRVCQWPPMLVCKIQREIFSRPMGFQEILPVGSTITIGLPGSLSSSQEEDGMTAGSE